MKGRIKYILVFSILLIIEIFIGVYLKNGFIRTYGGDILILPLLFSLIRIFWIKNSRGTYLYLPAGLFFFGICVEVMQTLNITGILGIRQGSILGIIIGSTGDVKDVLCYAIGVIFIYAYNAFEYYARLSWQTQV